MKRITNFEISARALSDKLRSVPDAEIVLDTLRLQR